MAVKFDSILGKLRESDAGEIGNETDPVFLASEAASFVTGDKTKLDGIAQGAEVNINADWNAGSGDAQILNKPTIPDELADLADDATHRVVTDAEKSTWNGAVPNTRTVNGHALNADVTVSKSDVSLGNVPNTDATVAGNVVVTTQNVIQTTNLDTAITNLDDSITALNDSGFGAWTSGADNATYTLSGGTFTLDRSGYGYVNGKKITWSSGQSVGSFAANTFYWIYIDSSGNLQKTSTFISSTIRLFELLYDGTIYVVCKENHPVGFDQSASGYLHNNAGTTIRSTGAIITRVASGTGAAAGDRQIKIVGADTLDDHGLSTTISAQDPVTWNVFYRNGSGKWIRYAQQTELPIYYNNAGTPTALGSAPNFGEYVLYVAKDDIENSAPQYIAIMGETSSVSAAAVLAIISAGTAIYSTNELKSIEAAQLGYAVVQYSATGGYIEELQVAKSSFNQVLVGGSAGSDHGLLSGLADDDHTQYHNDTRGNALYVAKNGAITGATKTKITYDAKGLVTTGADATTADIADSLDKRYCTDAQKTVIGNTSGSNSGDNANAGTAQWNANKIQGKDFPTLGAGDDNKYPKYVNGSNAFVMTAIAGGGDMLGANNLSDVASAQTSRNNILPSKTGNSLKVLRVNTGETDYEVATISGGGISAGLAIAITNCFY